MTVKQESALAVLLQRQEIHGPPAYFTPDWQTARQSVERLAELQPFVAATGHGVPMQGEPLRHALETLARDFDRMAVPARGRYVPQPARFDERGPVYVPPPLSSPEPCTVMGLAAVALFGAAAAFLGSRR